MGNKLFNLFKNTSNVRNNRRIINRTNYINNGSNPQLINNNRLTHILNQRRNTPYRSNQRRHSVYRLNQRRHSVYRSNQRIHSVYRLNQRSNYIPTNKEKSKKMPKSYNTKFECCVCYTPNSTKKKLIPCNHNLCKKCYLKLNNKTCPLCRNLI